MMLEGKGRGVVATRDIVAGEVVMATPPLALVTSPLRQRPNGELVVDAVLERRLYGSKWFSVLYDGSARSCKAQLELAPAPASAAAAAATAAGEVGEVSGSSGVGGGADAPRSAQVPEPLLASTSTPTAAATAAAAGGGKAAGAAAAKKKGFLASRGAARRSAGKATTVAVAGAEGAGEQGAAAELLPLPDRREQTRLAKVVKFNCFGDDAEDLAACACRGEEPRGHIGLWPEFAMLNHSCAPNTVNYVVGDSMVVRACRPIKEGEEVTICYLGRPQLLPFSKRIALLEEDYGFECSCVRCMAEQANYEKVEDAYLELAEAVEEQLGPAFMEARARGDTDGIEEVQREVAVWLRKLYGLFRKTLLAPDVRQYVVASMYDAYDLALNCSAALGQGEDASSLQACLKSIELVSAGSDLHVLLSVRYFDWCLREHGADSALTGLARGSLRRAHVARYGPVSDAVLEQLVSYNRKLHLEATEAA